MGAEGGRNVKAAAGEKGTSAAPLRKGGREEGRKEGRRRILTIGEEVRNGRKGE